jgi:hypothetical protein
MRKRSIQARLDEIRGKLSPKPETAAEVFAQFLLIQERRDEERSGVPGLTTYDEMYAWVRGWMEEMGEDPDMPFEDYPPTTTEGEG